MTVPTLEAGRDFDALVAEKVFGCKVERSNYEPHYPGKVSCGCGWNEDTKVHRIFYGKEFSSRDRWRGSINFFSTEIDAAWTLIEKTKDRLFWSIEMGFQPGWVITIGIKGSSNKDFRMPVCESAPMAICLAAIMGIVSAHEEA